MILSGFVIENFLRFKTNKHVLDFRNFHQFIFHYPIKFMESILN